MDPVSIGALTTLIRSVFSTIKTLREKGDLTAAEAKSLMDEADARRQEAVDAWNALAPDGDE